MKIRALFVSAVLALGLLQSAFALEPGDQAPEISPAKFLAGTPFKTADLKGSAPCLAEFFASWSDDGVAGLKTLAKLKKDWAKQKLEVLAISSEDEKDVAKILPKAGGCPVALDAKNAAETAYMSSEPATPCFFLIDKNGTLVWKGSASDVSTILKLYMDGKFSVEDSKRVSSLRKSVAEALTSKSLNKAIDASDEILKILPADVETVKLRLAIYDMQGNRKQSLDFLDGLIEKAPDASSLYFSRLDLMLHAEPKAKSEDIAKFAVKAAAAFKGDAESLNNLAWILVDETEFGDAPLETALKASEDSVALLPPKDSDADMRAAALDTLARIYSYAGRLDKAVELQNEALELWKGTDDEARCKKLVEYYKTALKLKGSQSETAPKN